MIGSVRRAVHVLAALALGAGAFVALASAPASAADPLGYVIAQGEGECWLASVDLVTGETTTHRRRLTREVRLRPRVHARRHPPPRHPHRRQRRRRRGATSSSSTSPPGPHRHRGRSATSTVGGPGQRPGQPHVHAERRAVHLPRSRGRPARTRSARGRSRMRRQRVLPLPREHRRHDRPHVRNSVPQQFTVYHGLATSCAGVTSSVRDPLREDDELPRAAVGTARRPPTRTRSSSPR